jgi:hypothetical protein
MKEFKLVECLVGNDVDTLHEERKHPVRFNFIKTSGLPRVLLQEL